MQLPVGLDRHLLKSKPFDRDPRHGLVRSCCCPGQDYRGAPHHLSAGLLRCHVIIRDLTVGEGNGYSGSDDTTLFKWSIDYIVLSVC